MSAETQRISGEITVQYPFLLRDVTGKEIDRYPTMSDAEYGATGLADGWIVIVQEHLFAPIPGYWGMFEEKMCGICGLLKSRHDTFVSQEVFQAEKDKPTDSFIVRTKFLELSEESQVLVLTLIEKLLALEKIGRE